MKHAKRIGALICVIAICFTLIAAPSAHAVGALGGQAAGAWIGAGLVALNIVADIAIGSIGNYFGWQAHPTSTTLLEQDIKYTFPVASQYISDYMNASTVVVRQGVTTIDGVEYDEVFVEPGEFNNGLKTNLFDFKTKWNILSGQSGITLAEGAGFINGETPVYSVNDKLRTADFSMSGVGVAKPGDIAWARVTKSESGSYAFSMSNAEDFVNQYGQIQANDLVPVNIRFQDISNAGSSISVYRYVNAFPSWGYRRIGSASINYVAQPFHFKYTSGIIPAESEIPQDYGLSIQIPHDQLQTFYNTYPQYNVDNSVINIQEDQVDIDELTQAIFDRITSMDQIKVSWASGEEPVPPEPGPPEPVPPEPAEDVLEGINTITGQQYESNKIQYQDYVIQQQQLQQQQQQLQQQQQQLQQQQQINQNTNDIKDAIENATETPSEEQLPDFKFDLREFFPFCIPFDIYNLLTNFDAEPVAPHVQIPFVIESLNFSYNIDLDFSVFDPVALILRTVEFIVYALGLAWATGKVIKW